MSRPRSPAPPVARLPDFGRGFARMLCLIFGILGALPLGAGFFARSSFAQAWISRETSRLLRETLELDATYSVNLSLWPLQVSINQLNVDGADGKGSAVSARRIEITPRVFSLMAGRLDIGNIEIQGAKVRLVVENGSVKNVHLRVPDSSDTSAPEVPRQSPFRSFSASDLDIDLTLNGMQVTSRNIDLDVFSEGGLVFEASLGVGESWIRYPKDFFVNGHTYDVPWPAFGPQQLSQWEEDRICRLSLRTRLAPDGILIRSLMLQGVADTDVLPGNHVHCPKNDAERQLANFVDIAAQRVHVEPGDAHKSLLLHGNLTARIPTNLVNRVTDVAGPFDGWAAIQGEVSYDGRTRLPEFAGKITIGEFKIDGFRITEGAEGDVMLRDDHIIVPLIHIRYGAGMVDVADTTIGLFEPGKPLHARRVDGSDVRFPYLIRDVKITPDTIVNWNLKKTRLTDFKGTLDPPKLGGDVQIETSDLEIFDRSYRDPKRQHIFGITPNAHLNGRFGVSPAGLEFNDVTARFGESELNVTVHIGFNDTLFIDLRDAQINLSEISPLVSVPMAGFASFQAKVEGPLSNPLLLGKVAIKDFVFGGFPVGDLTPADVRFRPLWFELSGTSVQKGRSTFRIPTSRFDFQSDAAVAVRAHMQTEKASMRDFLRMWNFDTDPRWSDLQGELRADADIQFALGGPRDPCQGGDLLVRGSLQAEQATIFGQDYDSAKSDISFHWEDIDASYHGMSVDLDGIHLTKGDGSILGSAHIRPGATVLGNFVATAVPMNKIQGFGPLGQIMSGTVSAVAHVGGTLDNLETTAQATLSPMIVGRSRYPASSLSVRLVPIKTPVTTSGVTHCNRPIPLPTVAEELSSDKAAGVFHIDGEMFDGQIVFDDFQTTRQTHKVAKGSIAFNRFDLGPLLEHFSELGLVEQKPKGNLSAKLEIKQWPFDSPGASDGSLTLSSLWIAANGYQATIHAAQPFQVHKGLARIPNTAVDIMSPFGPSAQFEGEGTVAHLGTEPALNVKLKLQPVDLEAWRALNPDIEKLQGVFSGDVNLGGTLSQPRYQGGFTLRGGALSLGSANLALSNISADIALQNNLLSLTKASAALGGGTLSAQGQAPLKGLSLGQFEGTLVARNISYAFTEDVQSSFSADLEGTWPIAEAAVADGNEPVRVLPKITGTVDVLSFNYKRPVTLSADISTLARRGKRTEFESYDPSLDRAELDILITSQVPLRIENNLLEASLTVDRPGLQLTGTNQRFGLKGRMEVDRGGRIDLRRNEFTIQTGELRFDDSTTIMPRVDVTAVNEFRRNSSSDGSATAADSSVGSGGTTPGQWRIAMHAHGDADDLRVDLSSDPALSQDDIFLLLTVGLTRVELDRAQSEGLGSSVALEALGSLTNAGSAVKNVIPLDFSFGSAYSSRTARSEPTVTVSKRLSDRIRAFVTTRIAESRDVRANLEWTLSPQISVQGSYDNNNEISTPMLGNVGADVRWRIEFE